MSYITDTTLSQPMALKQVLLIRNDNDNVFILSVDFETLGRRLLTAYPVCVSTKCYVLFGRIGVHRVTDTYWSEELWSGDGGTVTVEFNPTAQIKIANLHRRNLQETSEQEITSAPKWLPATDRHDYAFTVCLETSNHLIKLFKPQMQKCILNFWLAKHAVVKDSPCARVHTRCFQASGLCGPYLQEHKQVMR